MMPATDKAFKSDFFKRSMPFKNVAIADRTAGGGDLSEL